MKSGIPDWVERPNLGLIPAGDKQALAWHSSWFVERTNKSHKQTK
jgi:hypothetical protein